MTHTRTVVVESKTYVVNVPPRGDREYQYVSGFGVRVRVFLDETSVRAFDECTAFAPEIMMGAALLPSRAATAVEERIFRELFNVS